MTKGQGITIKKNVSKFDGDVRETGSYGYTTDRLSARLANNRISDEIAQSYDFSRKKVLDLGCGDGAYTLEFLSLGVREIIGVDPAGIAIDAANIKAKKLGLDALVKFEVGNIYALDSYINDNRFDCIVLRGVLHHLPDAARAIAGLTTFNGTIIVLEPNGNNPVLKLIERFSRYHIAHEERSFSPSLIFSWLIAAEFRVHSCRLINLIPFFCPDWMARVLRAVGPFIERVPLLRDIACGQVVIVARR
uniref:2-polyprenyl-3-methyl-5-hydroxy-6-metoxy-1,4-benzoquinol methylase n=1 Tax=Candidatus Kentrum sp. LPFa TaxID=2126335 RepID=A0A450X9A2_9GAMM|nr:MAG: 2-polyprenyl-3-methyl-5-hydroxy-6-metoxy-1,4-benzoquinol methylase [Candidatus Kentron sp. LPFa]VFK25770.1 MAG: 2-polyprenyl-3-methyl-5-hydroxy-6-metoxy-1,4-benzoquinol methylase [Candidatus Kentron sp. LPFa]